MKSRFILSAGLLLTLAAMAGVTAARAQDDAKYPPKLAKWTEIQHVPAQNFFGVNRLRF